MWATNYKTDNNLSVPFPGILSDGRLFTDYNTESNMNQNLKQTNNIKNNTDYRRFLVQNTNTIKKNNFNKMILENRSQTRSVPSYGSPHLFQGVDDTSIPFGYESSFPKNLYLSRQQIDDKKRRHMQNGFES